MAELIKLTCSNCGAPLEVDTNKEFVFCMHCGQKLLIERENKVKSGYEIEKGRQKYLHELESIEAELAEAESQLKIAKDKVNGSGGGLRFGGMVFLALGFITLFGDFGIGLLEMLMGIGIMVLGSFISSSATNEQKNEIRKLTSKVQKLKNKRDKMLK